MVRTGKARRGLACMGSAVMARFGLSRCELACSGSAVLACRGTVRLVRIRYGSIGAVGSGRDSLGLALCGMAVLVRLVKLRYVLVWQYWHGSLSLARSVSECPGLAVLAGYGMQGSVTVWQCLVGQGSIGRR